MGDLRHITRRHFFSDCRVGLGSIALGGIFAKEGWAASRNPLAPRRPHFEAKAKNVIFMFMAGGPSQLELFEDKPELTKFNGQAPPDQFMKGKRFSFLGPEAKLLGGTRKFNRYGQSGATLSELLPYHREIVDDVCFIRSMKTDVFNHGPAKIFLNTGSPQPGRPSMGAWTTYGIGSEATDLPGFVVLQSGPRGPRAGSSLWSSGFLPTTHQGVPFRSSGDPIVNLTSPSGIKNKQQRQFYDAVSALNQKRLQAVGDPEIETRIAAYEMAYRMQSSAPELMEIEKEPKHVLEMYGAEPGASSYANNCLLARRMVERGVRFVQLYHTDWDHHGGPGMTLDKDLTARCQEIDKASAALVKDLKTRGLLDETLVIWGGEFGRTPMGETRENKIGGRDHFIDAYTMWLAGAGVKPGTVYGATDELGLSVTENPVHVHDLQATILHLLGLDHEQLTFRFQGRQFRLTDVHGKVVEDILA
ncbi:MAG: DUF1501 domain-containing protein [Verrucomicrobiota bacterium]